MGFAENLENDLKNLESAEERDPAAVERRHSAREAERAAALAAQPHAQQLRNSKFTAEFLNQVSLQGRSQRIPVRITWLGPSLKLLAKDHALELQPTAAGVEGRFLRGTEKLESFTVDFAGSPAELARRWLQVVADTP
jgi:hypothetical protein